MLTVLMVSTSQQIISRREPGVATAEIVIIGFIGYKVGLFALQKPAFSKDDLLPMDLGTFYREFQNPPQLTSLSIDVSAQSMAEDLVRKTLQLQISA